MEFMSTPNQVNPTHVEILLEVTETLIALRDACEHDSLHRFASVKLYEGTCDPNENFGMLGINHAEGERAQVTILTIPPENETLRNIVNHVFRSWNPLETFLGDQTGWFFRPSTIHVESIQE